jgi:hypothetical protein
LLAAMLFFTVTVPTHGQDSPLRVEIKTAQAAVKNSRDFEVRTKVENVGIEEQILYLSQCSYSAIQWTADNPSIHVKKIFYKENALIDIRLKPGEVTEGALPVRIEIPDVGLPQEVTFRLGFSPRDGAISIRTNPTLPQSSAPVPPIWSNAITLAVK